MVRIDVQRLLATVSSLQVKERFGGRLVVAGNTFDGVGAADCVKSGVFAAAAAMGTSREQ